MGLNLFPEKPETVGLGQHRGRVASCAASVQRCGILTSWFRQCAFTGSLLFCKTVQGAFFQSLRRRFGCARPGHPFSRFWASRQGTSVRPQSLFHLVESVHDLLVSFTLFVEANEVWPRFETEGSSSTENRVRQSECRKKIQKKDNLGRISTSDEEKNSKNREQRVTNGCVTYGPLKRGKI